MNYRHSADEPKRLSATFPRYSIWTLLRTMAVLALGYVLLLAYLHYNSDAELRKTFGGSAGLAALRSADRVEAYRIDKLPEPITLRIFLFLRALSRCRRPITSHSVAHWKTEAPIDICERRAYRSPGYAWISSTAPIAYRCFSVSNATRP
jgi:hypothetical protein